MKDITLKIRINEHTGKIAFLVDKNHIDTVASLLQFIGVLELVKNAHLEKLGEMQGKELKNRDSDEEEEIEE